MHSSVEKSKLHWRGLFRNPSFMVSHLFITAAFTICALAGEIAMSGFLASMMLRAEPAVCMWMCRFASAPPIIPS